MTVATLTSPRRTRVWTLLLPGLPRSKNARTASALGRPQILGADRAKDPVRAWVSQRFQRCSRRLERLEHPAGSSG